MVIPLPKKQIYSCNVCKKSFSLLNKLTRHKKVHESEFEYKCSACGKSFAQKHILDVHIARKHIEDKSHGCDSCGKAFATVYDLQRHIKTHTGSKPHQCDSCDKAFSTSGDLVRHKRIHTGEKPYKCELCARPFARIGSCLRHQKTHSEGKKHMCDICNEAFTRPWNLLVHKRTHTGEKPYRCDACTKSFSLLRELQSYKKLHVKTKTTTQHDKSMSSASNRSERNKTHNCATCDKEFTNKDDMQKHVQFCKESFSSNYIAENKTRHSERATKLGVGNINVSSTNNPHDTAKEARRTHAGENCLTSDDLTALASLDDKQKEGNTYQCVHCHSKCTMNYNRAVNFSCSVDQTRTELDELLDTAYVCSLCGVSFETNILLNNHIINNHEN